MPKQVTGGFLNKFQPLGANDTQQAIFKIIWERPRTKSDIALSLDLSEKTIANNIAQLKKIVDNTDGISFIRNVNKDKDSVYCIVEQRNLIIKLLPKIYTYVRSHDKPYIIINLPSPPKPYTEWIVMPFGDMHYGADTCDVELLKSLIDYVLKTPNVLVLLKGDLIENANKESPGASVYTQVIPPQDQKDQLIELLAPIAHRILYSVRGNHGFRSVKGAFLDPEKDISHALGIEYFVGAVYADIVCEDNGHLFKWEFMSMHGNSHSSTPEGRIKILRKKSEFHSADIYTMGHVHDLQHLYDYEIVRNPQKLTLDIKKRYYVICGTTMNYWKSYAEEWVLQPNKTGFAKIHLSCAGSKTPGGYSVST